MEEDSDEDERPSRNKTQSPPPQPSSSAPQPPLLPPNPEQVLIRKDYDPKGIKLGLIRRYYIYISF